VECFCIYPSVPVVVTSREVGYEASATDEKRFEIFRLEPFVRESRGYVEVVFS